MKKLSEKIFSLFVLVLWAGTSLSTSAASSIPSDTDLLMRDALKLLPREMAVEYLADKSLKEGLVSECVDALETQHLRTFPACQPSGSVYAMTEYNDELYAGGTFKTAGGKIVNSIAKWNGTSWYPLGNASLDGIVLDMAVNNGLLYIVGGFTIAGMETLNNIAAWNGSAWQSVGDGTNGTIRAIEPIGNETFITGDFTQAGNVAAKQVAKWNGSIWSALGAGVSGLVSDAASVGTDLYLGGSIIQADGISSSRVVKWDGASWSSLEQTFQTLCLASDGANLYSGELSGDIYKWTGTSKTKIGTMNGAIESLEFVGTTLYAGGSFSTASGTTQTFNIARRVGTNWSSLGFGVNGRVLSLYNLNGTLQVGGSFSQVGTSNANNIARWSGSNWSRLSCQDNNDIGISGTVSSIIKKGTDIYASGSFIYVDNKYVNYIARFDGTSWHSLSFGLNGHVNSMEIYGNDLYVCGNFQQQQSSSTLALGYVARWTGSSWAAVGGGVSSTANVLKIFNGELYIAGYFTQAGGQPANRIAKWNGSSWSAVGHGVNFYINAMTVHNNELYIGGIFRTSNGVNLNRVAKWDGTNWVPLGAGVDNEVFALTSFNGRLYAGGSFMNAGNQAVRRIAQWDGLSWSAVGTGADKTVRSLESVGNLMYTGGIFDEIGGHQFSYFAKWDGANWTSQNQFDGPVYCIYNTLEGIYVGGSFDEVSGCVSNGLVRINTTSSSSCSDGIKNGDETFLDCGGSCASCTNCSHGAVTINDNPMANELYVRSSNNILSSGRVANNHNALFQAANAIELLPNFEVSITGQFQATIFNCLDN